MENDPCYKDTAMDIVAFRRLSVSLFGTSEGGLGSYLKASLANGSAELVTLSELRKRIGNNEAVDRFQTDKPFKHNISRADL